MKKLITFVSAAAICGAASAQDIKLSLQAYTFRDRSFVETVETARRLGIKYLESYPGQRLGGDFEGTTDYNRIKPETVTRLKQFLAESGVKVVSYGVTGAGSAEQWDKLMTFAKAMGIETIQIECDTNLAKFDLAEKAADKHGVKVAIHNHSQDSGKPAAILKQLEGRGKNIGAGCDIGHWVRANVVPLDGVKLLKGKFITMHLVDVERMGGGARDVPYGSGVANVKGVLDELKAQKFKGYLTLEYEHMSSTLEQEVGACVRWFNAYQAGALAANGQLASANIDTLWAGFTKTGKPDLWETTDTEKEKEAIIKKLAGLQEAAIAAGSIKGSAPGFNNEGPEKGFGNNQGNKYCQEWQGKAFVSCTLTAPGAITYYTISSSNDGSNRDPSEWKLYGSNDGQTWKELDHRKDQRFGVRFHLRGFEIKNPSPFRDYKLEILKHNGDTSMQFSRFVLYKNK